MAQEFVRTVKHTARTKSSLASLMSQVELWVVAAVLRAHGGNRTTAATALGISRKALDAKLMALAPQPAKRQNDKLVISVVPQSTLREMRLQVEGWLIAEALREAGGNKSRAAPALGISREGLHKRLWRVDLKPPARKPGTKVMHIAVKNGPLAKILRQVDAWLIAAALREHRGNKTRTAIALGLTREAVYRKMESLGMDPEAFPREF